MFKFKRSPEKNNEVDKRILNNLLTILQESGDISKVNESITLDNYNALKEQYGKLAKKITDPKLLFELNKCQAIIDFRVFDEHKTHLKLDEHKKHLSKAYKDNPDRNQSIIELGLWNARYKALPGKQQEKMSATSLLDDHFKNLTTVVNLYLKQKEYTEALKEMNGLEKSTNSKVVSLYVGIHIMAGNFSETLKHCTDTMNYAGEDVQIKENYYKFYKSLADQFKELGATEQANGAAKIAETYSTTTSVISPEVVQAQQTVKEMEKKLTEAMATLKQVEANNKTKQEVQELKARHEEELARVAATLEAEYNAKIEEMNLRISQVVNNEILVKPNAPSFDTLPPTYSSATGLYPKVPTNNMMNEIIPTTSTGTGPVITIIEDNAEDTATRDNSVVTSDAADDSKDTEIEPIVTNAAQAEVDEITKILHSEKPDMDRVVVLCKRAIGKQGDLYKIIDDSVVLLSLASAYLDLAKPMEAKEAVNKVVNDAIKNDKNVYDETEDSSVLNLIAEEYKEEGLLRESVEACKKAVSQPGYKPCVKSYQLLKEIGETKNLTNKKLALDALNVAKDNAADDLQKYHIHATIIKMHLSLNKLDDAKGEYAELLNNVSYQTVHEFAKSCKEIQWLIAVDGELIKYKLLSDKYKTNPTKEKAGKFHYDMESEATKCEIKTAYIMQTNIRLHTSKLEADIQKLIHSNSSNKIISHLAECYNKHYPNTIADGVNEMYVEAIGDIANCIFGE